MANILCIETATTNCSVALSINGECAFLKEDNGLQYSHAERLHLYADEVFAFAKANNHPIHAVAVSKGPGSYTGLRIGVSAAKGWCYAHDLPLISVPTLDALARQVQPESGVVIPMLDARRMEVYSAVYDTSFTQTRDTQAQVLDATSFENYLSKGLVYFVGDGVAKFKEVCTHTNARFTVGNLPSAQQMCHIAETKYSSQQLEDVAYFEPYYLKDFIAGTPKKR